MLPHIWHWVRRVEFPPRLGIVYNSCPHQRAIHHCRVVSVSVREDEGQEARACTSALIFKDMRGRKGVAMISGLVAVFSMATRNLKSRILRTMLILASILTITISFVALTSLSKDTGSYTTGNSSNQGDTISFSRLKEVLNLCKVWS